MINKETSDLKKIDPWTTMVPFIAIFILCLFFYCQTERVD